ncbi:MAG: RNA methyltransferase [Alphaproteobacteria bacterium]|nr:RNA methyltransferase [Alphaproteobacteria bacterium]
MSELNQDPAIILVAPQMGENIGAAARAMHNFALSDLRIVRPRDGWPNPAAVPMAASADFILEEAQLFGETSESISDLHYVVATTARRRGMIKPELTPREAVQEMRRKQAEGLKTGILFGGERSGLDNEDVTLADAILSVPTNPDFRSINLAQAVLLIGYEWFISAPAVTERDAPALEGRAAPASKHDILVLMEHLERELDRVNFFYPEEKRDSMIRNLRNFWARADLREQDIRTLHGVIVALAGEKTRAISGEGEDT